MTLAEATEIIARIADGTVYIRSANKNILRVRWITNHGADIVFICVTRKSYTAYSDIATSTALTQEENNAVTEYERSP